jgi:hypothetical protein
MMALFLHKVNTIFPFLLLILGNFVITYANRSTGRNPYP